MGRILIVDDDKDIRDSLKRLLLKDSHEILVTENGESALESINRKTFDLILVDQLMPGLNGLEMVKILREKKKNIPVIMMTGHGSVRLVVEFMRNGGVDFIEKPFDIEVVRVKIRKAMREKALEEQLRAMERAQQIAEDSNHAKSAFLANLSHEFRSPMHVILSFASLGKQRYASLSPEKLHSYFDRIEKSGNSLIKLLEDVITLAKLETDRMTFKEEEFDVIEFVQRHINHLKREKPSPDIIMQKKSIDSLVRADRYMIQTVLDKVVDNAVKYGENTPIEISGYRRRNQKTGSEEIVVRVADGGKGIPEDEITTVFDAFTQSSNTDTGAGGSGLGLSICKEIIKLHKGSMWAENNKERGCSISFALPVVDRSWS